MKENRLPNIVLVGQLSRVKLKASHPQMRSEDVLKEVVTSWEVIKRETLKKSGGRRSVRSFVVLRRLGTSRV